MGKISLICALVLAVCATSSFAGTIPTRFIWWPKDDGSGSVPAFLEHSATDFSALADPNNIHFYLFTLNNRDIHDEIANTTSSVDASHWDRNAPVKIFAHGFSSSWDGGSSLAMRNVFIKTGYPQNVNLVIVDWKALAAAPWYEVAAKGTSLVGEKIAYLVDFLVRNQYTTLDKVHVFGHSLGAHASGWAGSIYQSLSGSKIPRITGLDPALPLFGVEPDSGRLDPTDGDFVDVIHSAAGTLLESGLAFTEPRGHVDFYPNTGKKQPGCGLDIAGSCSHSRCYEYYGESIHFNQFRAVKCDDDAWDDKFESCSSSKGEERMGEWTPSTARGIYYLTTNNKAPWAQG